MKIGENQGACAIGAQGKGVQMGGDGEKGLGHLEGQVIALQEAEGSEVAESRKGGPKGLLIQYNKDTANKGQGDETRSYPSDGFQGAPIDLTVCQDQMGKTHVFGKHHADMPSETRKEKRRAKEYRTRGIQRSEEAVGWRQSTKSALTRWGGRTFSLVQ